MQAFVKITRSFLTVDSENKFLLFFPIVLPSFDCMSQFEASRLSFNVLKYVKDVVKIRIGQLLPRKRVKCTLELEL